MTNYAKGYQLEWKTKKLLEELDWMVFRSPASKDAADVFATKKGKTLLIQCKKTSKSRLYVYGLDGLIEIARKHKAIPLLVYSFYYTPIYAKEVKEKNMKVLKDGRNIKLESYLSQRKMGRSIRR